MSCNQFILLCFTVPSPGKVLLLVCVIDLILRILASIKRAELWMLIWKLIVRLQQFHYLHAFLLQYQPLIGLITLYFTLQSECCIWSSQILFLDIIISSFCWCFLRSPSNHCHFAAILFLSIWFSFCSLSIWMGSFCIQGLCSLSNLFIKVFASRTVLGSDVLDVWHGLGYQS